MFVACAIFFRLMLDYLLRIFAFDVIVFDNIELIFDFLCECKWNIKCLSPPECDP